MTFKPALWRPIAIGLSGINVAAAGYAAGLAEPWHAATHAALSVAFGLWAQRLRRRPDETERHTELEVLEGEVSDLRRELNEAQERLDFTERLLAQDAESRRVARDR